MTPNPTIVGRTRALQPERDALEVSKILSATEKADKKAIVHCLLINTRAGEHQMKPGDSRLRQRNFT